MSEVISDQRLDRFLRRVAQAAPHRLIISQGDDDEEVGWHATALKLVSRSIDWGDSELYRLTNRGRDRIAVARLASVIDRLWRMFRLS